MEGVQNMTVTVQVDFYFRLSDVTGKITARRESIATGSYTLVVAAVDGGTPPRRVQSALTIVVNISTSGELRRLETGDNNFTIVIIMVGTSLPVAILLIAAILVVLRDRRCGERRAVVTPGNIYDSKSSPNDVATQQEYATLSRGRTSTKLATATISRSNNLAELPSASLMHLNSSCAQVQYVAVYK